MKAAFKSNTIGENMSCFMTVDSKKEQIVYLPLDGISAVSAGITATTW